MFNFPLIPLMQYGPVVDAHDNEIEIINWIGGKTCSVKLNLEKYCWEVSDFISITILNGKLTQQTSKVSLKVDLYDFYKMVTLASEIILKYDSSSKFGETKRERGKREGIQKWMLRRVGGSISKRLCSAMRAIIHKYVPPDISLIHKTIIQIFGIKKYTTVLHHNDINDEFLKDNKYLINDIKNGYKSAICYLWFSKKSVFFECPAKESQEWIKLFLKRGDKPYPALMKTLLHNHRISHEKLITVCKKHRLPKEFQTSLEFRVWLDYYNIAVYSAYGSVTREVVKNLSCIEKSDKKQILKAKQLLEKHLQQKIDFRTRNGISSFVRFLYDYPNNENCEIVKLMERSIIWHRQQRQRQIEASIAQIKENTNKLTMVPPIPLPNNKNITFLANCQAILDEGRKMFHCIGSYANNAFRGQCYLFHVEWDGHMASAEVTNDGRLQQIHGPYNKDDGNKAVEYGKRILGKWCGELRKHIAEHGIVPLTVIPYQVPAAPEALEQVVGEELEAIPF